MEEEEDQFDSDDELREMVEKALRENIKERNLLKIEKTLRIVYQLSLVNI